QRHAASGSGRHAFQPRHSPAGRRFTPSGAAGPTVEAASLSRYLAAPLPPPLLGSSESLARQNQINESEGLERILDNEDLNDRISQHLLVPLPASASLLVNGDLPRNRRYCRPWTSHFLSDFAR